MGRLFSEDMRRNPYPMYAEMRRRGPVAHVPDLNLWMLLEHAAVKWALADADALSNDVSGARGATFEWLLFTDPPRHTHLRAIVQRAFTPRSIAALEPRVRAISGSLLDELLGGGDEIGETREVDLVSAFAAPLPMMVMAELLGLPAADWPRLRRWSEIIVDLGVTIVGDRESARAAGEAFRTANAEMTDAIGELVARRRAAPGDDLITRLVWADAGGARLADEEILRFVQLLLAAGTETTTNLVDNAVLCLLENPGELARLRAEPALLPSAIEEVLRYRSPGQAMFRVARRELDVGGARIPAGAFVMPMIGAANRDPAAFAEPDRFDISRDPNPHVAFGHGIHFCLGAALSRLEARVALGDLLARVDYLELASDRPWPPRRAFHVHGPTHLPLRLRSSGSRGRREAPLPS